MKIVRLFAFLVTSLTLATAASALNIAVSNDDGWDSPGIQALKAELEARGHTVTLAGPLDGQSGSSAAIDIVIPPAEFLSITRHSANEYSVAKPGGTEGAEPATSALIAISISTEANGAAPDLLLTGIIQPVAMKNAGLIDTLISMCTKIVTLRLQQVCR